MLDKIIFVFQLSATNLLNLIPYIILGLAIAELLKYKEWSEVIAKVHHKSVVFTTVLAALAGMVSPLCTYGTIPIILKLINTGFPLYPLITFLCASSLMNPQLFIITWGGIHPEMALARFIAVFGFCFILGLILFRIGDGWITNPNLIEDKNRITKCVTKSKKSFELKIVFCGFLKSARFISFYMIIGIFFGAVFEVFIPAQWIFRAFKTDVWLSVTLASLLGVPLYACGGGAIPLIASLMKTGMSQGAALAFFIVGPATRLTPLIAMSTVIRPKFIFLYVIFLLIFSIMTGYLYTLDFFSV